MYYDDPTMDEKDRPVVRPEQNFQGLSYGDWAAAWTNWLFSEDADRNEAQGSTLFLRGNIEHYGQDDKSFYDRTGDRCVVISKGTSILIPILTTTNFIGSQHEGNTYESEAQIRSAAQRENDNSGGIWALIQRLKNKGEWEPIVKDLLCYRVTSPVFTITIPERSAFLEKLTPLYSPGAGEHQAVTEGFFVLMKWLPEDTCRLQFGGKGRSNYRTNSIYDIHIADRSKMLVRDITPNVVTEDGKAKLNPNLASPSIIKLDTYPPLTRLPD
jgi:hypothetical protein